MKKRIFCTNKNGRDLFYMDVHDYPELNSIWLQFSMGRMSISNTDTERLMRCIEERLVPDELRNEFIKYLFEAIKKIPDVEQVFIPESLLTKDGKYSESTYNALEEIYKDYIPENFEPLTQMSGYPFDDICGHLYLKAKDENVQQLTQEEFAKVTSHSERLSSVYFQLENSQNKYFNTTIKSNKTEIEVFWMVSINKTVLIFMVQI
jgi:hypothetical protein